MFSTSARFVSRDTWVKQRELFRLMSNIQYVSTWTATIYTVHGARFPRGSACVYTVHVVKTSIGNNFTKTRQLNCYDDRR